METKKLTKVLVTVAVVLIVVFGAYRCTVGNYNKMVQSDEAVKTQWAQVENDYQRRFDLIPNLVATAKGYAKHESDVFTQVAEARSQAGGVVKVDSSIVDNPEEFKKYQQVQDNLGSSLQRLLMVTENYPELKADARFAAVMDELEGTENRISVERKRFNDAAKEYNTYIRTFPNNIIAGMFHFESKPYFEAAAAAATAPKVEF